MRERVSVLTGMAFPVGAILGVVFGNLTAPASTGGGFGDIIYALFWFIIGAPLVTSLTYAVSSRNVDWEPGTRGRAALTVALGILLATMVLVFMITALGRGVGAVALVVGLPMSALVVTMFVRRALRV